MYERDRKWQDRQHKSTSILVDLHTTQINDGITVREFDTITVTLPPTNTSFPREEMRERDRENKRKPPTITKPRGNYVFLTVVCAWMRSIRNTRERTVLPASGASNLQHFSPTSTLHVPRRLFIHRPTLRRIGLKEWSPNRIPLVTCECLDEQHRSAQVVLTPNSKVSVFSIFQIPLRVLFFFAFSVILRTI